MTWFHKFLPTCLCAAALVGCVQMPTESQGAVDQRPRIGFTVASDMDSSTARVVVDGLDMGPLSRYQDAMGSLPLLPGSHLIQVRDKGRILFQETVYLADGARRSLVVNASTP